MKIILFMTTPFYNLITLYIAQPKAANNEFIADPPPAPPCCKLAGMCGLLI
jgi:hypothetical protein